MELISTNLIDFYKVTSKDDIPELVNLFDKQELVAVDTEVYSLRLRYKKASNFDPHTSRVRLFQANYLGNYTPYVLDIKEIGVEGALPFINCLADKQTVAHSYAYDLKQILSTFGVRMKNPVCTKVAMQRLGICTGYKSSLMRGNTLKGLARDYFDIHLDKDLAESDWSADYLTTEQYTYSAMDVGAPKFSGLDSIILRGWLKLVEVLNAPPPQGYGVQEIHELDQRVMRELAWIEYVGMPVNRKMIQITQETNKRLLEEKKLAVCKHLQLPVEPRLNEDLEVEYVVSDATSRLLNNPKALVETLNKRLPTPLSDTRSESLEKILKDMEKTRDEEGSIDEEDISAEIQQDIENELRNIDMVRDLLDYKTLVKACGTDYLSLINEVTGNLHSSYQVNGASTGRMSSGGRKEGSFNAQQLANIPVSINIDEPFYCEGIIL